MMPSDQEKHSQEALWNMHLNDAWAQRWDLGSNIK